MKKLVVFLTIIVLAMNLDAQPFDSSKPRFSAGLESAFKFSPLYPSLGTFVKFGPAELNAFWKYRDDPEIKANILGVGVKLYLGEIGNNDCTAFLSYDYASNKSIFEQIKTGQDQTRLYCSDRHIVCLGLGAVMEDRFSVFLKIGASYNPRLMESKITPCFEAGVHFKIFGQ